MDDQAINCGICGERMTQYDIESGYVAEMYNPKTNDPSEIVHHTCGKWRGWELA